jgi:hypothetical protein
VQLNFSAREATIKLVYYGPALSGKTTNLRRLHELTREGSRGRLMTLETKDDRTLFFDMLPFVFRGKAAVGQRPMSLRLKVFTVPGQVLHASTRRLVLQGADGVAFVADAQTSATQANAASFVDLRENLHKLGHTMASLPLVIQFNKCDLPGARSPSELRALALRGREPVFAASAIQGEGVLETFFALLHVTWVRLEKEHQLARMVGVQPGAFVSLAATQMGYSGNIDELLARGVGRPLESLGGEGR